MYQTFQCPDFTVSQTVERVVGSVTDGVGTGSLDVGSLCYKPAAMEWSNSIYVMKVNQSHCRPEVPRWSRKLRFPDYVTMAQDVVRLSALRTGRF